MAVRNIVSFAGLLLFIQGCARAEVVTVSAGDTAVLSCTRSSDINITFWSGPPGFSTYNYPGSTTINEDLLNADRLEINGTSAELLIHNVKLSDEGSYKCSATSIGTAELQLVVTNISPYATVIHGIHDEKNKSVIWGTEDQNITLSCSAYGAKPKPYITWAVAERNTTFNSTVDTVEHANGTFDATIFYTFVADQLYDNVVFKCSIDHPTLQTPLEKAAVINLYLKPIFDSTQEQTIVSEQFEETVSCQVSGSRPRANISLYFDGEELTGHKDNIVTYNESSDTYETTALFRSKMDREDNGKPILCVVAHMALNANINRTWLIDVQFPPSIEVSGENVSLVPETVSLNCNAINGNPDNYTFSRWQHRWPVKSGNILREIESTSVVHNEASLMLENPTFQDSGYYKCLVSNGIETPANKDYKAEKDMFVLIKDVPVVTDGHTEYRSNTDETIEVLLDVYTNVEPVHASIATKDTETSETTAVWTIKENKRKTVWISVFGQNILFPGFRISADFEVQAEENYGDYMISVRNAIGSTTYDFKVLPRVDAAQGGQSQKEDETNVVGIVLGVIFSVLAVVGALIAFVVCRKRRAPTYTSC